MKKKSKTLGDVKNVQKNNVTTYIISNSFADGYIPCFTVTSNLNWKRRPVQEEKTAETPQTEVKTCLDAAIEVLKKSKTPMTLQEIYDNIVKENLFTFSESTKKPTTSISTRLSSYITKAGENSCIKKVKTGTFEYVDL